MHKPPEVCALNAGDDGARVAILEIPSATLELANPAQVAMIDEVEVGRPVAHPFPGTIRVAFEVVDAAATTAHLAAAGAGVVAPPTPTPWQSLNARLEAPDGMQLTVFEELHGAERHRAGHDRGGQEPGAGSGPDGAAS